jgi:LysM repeat protein
MSTIAIPSLVNSSRLQIAGATVSAKSSAVNQEIRLTPRGRLVARSAVVASLSILLLSAFSLFTGASAGSDETAKSSSYVKVSVKPGETLWSIAAALDPKGDRRDLVDELMRVNSLKSATLEAGQKIYLPTR